MEQWILVALTAVYVIATIFISFFNARSSKATRDQIKESRAQFIDSNRAFVNIDLEIVRDEVFVLRIMNNGNRTAQDVHIEISDDFLSVVSDQGSAEQIELLNSSTFSIGVGQIMFVRLGIIREYSILSQQPIRITLDYFDQFATYHEEKSIPISQYGWGWVYDSPINDIRGYMKSVSESVKKISNKISN